LEEAARSHRWCHLGVFLTAERGATAAPGSVAFRECVDWLNRLRAPVTPSLALLAWERVWQDGTPSPREALEVLSALGPRGCVELLPRLLDCLVRDADLRRLDRDREELAAALAGAPLAPDQKRLVEVCLLAGKLHQGHASARELEQLLRIAPATPSKFCDGSLELAATRVAQWPDPKEHRRLARLGFAQGHERFLKPYFRALETLIGARNPSRPARVAGLFRTWSDPRPEGSEPDRTVVAQLFPRLFRTLSSRELEQVSSLLALDRTENLWQQWRGEFLRPGFLSQLATWILPNKKSKPRDKR
jgi:hypothetical protein